jgi:hypothetical protein
MTMSVLPNKDGPVKHEDKRRRADIALQALIITLNSDYAHVILVFRATREEAIGGKAGGLDHYRVLRKSKLSIFISTMELYASVYKSNVQPHYDDIHLSKEGARILSERLAAGIGRVSSAE